MFLVVSKQDEIMAFTEGGSEDIRILYGLLFVPSISAS
jgi:hypothetical protein